MKTTYRPTPADKKLIREAALMATKQRKVTLRIGVLVPVDETRNTESFNALLVADNRDDTQTIDNMPWKDFADKANPLTADGRGEFDISIYEMPQPGQGQDFYLLSHVAIFVEGGKLAEAEYVTSKGYARLAVVDGVWVQK